MLATLAFRLKYAWFVIASTVFASELAAYSIVHAPSSVIECVTRTRTCRRKGGKDAPGR